ncbi:MAG: hypothetical protein ACE5EF_08070 [Dehalococcoidia bacterium]
MARRRSIIPSIPLPRRTLPWVLFVLGFVSIGLGALTGGITGVAIGVIALGGAITSWATEWLLGTAPPASEDEGDEA